MGAEIGIATGRFHARGPGGCSSSSRPSNMSCAAQARSGLNPLGGASVERQAREKKHAIARATANISRSAQADLRGCRWRRPTCASGCSAARSIPRTRRTAQISLTALKRLGLDQVWWLVTPGQSAERRGQAARASKRASRPRGRSHIIRDRRHRLRGRQRSAYTVDTLAELKRRFPGVNFVWLMGADNLARFHRWRAWEKLFGRRADRRARPPGLPAEGAREQGGAALCLLPGRRIRCARAGAAGASAPGPSSPIRSRRLSSTERSRQGRESCKDAEEEGQAGQGGRDKRHEAKKKRRSDTSY